MPIYEYVCGHCGKKQEVLQSMGADGEGLTCHACGAAELRKVFSAPNIGKGGGDASLSGGGCSSGCCSGGSCGL